MLGMLCKDREISMLPPPIATRLRSKARRTLSILALCPCVGTAAPVPSGVIRTVPTSCAYEYNISSLLDCLLLDQGYVEEYAFRCGTRL